MPKIRTTYGWETPASLATASVLVPAYPPREKARVAGGEDQLAPVVGAHPGWSVSAFTLDMLSVDYLPSEHK